MKLTVIGSDPRLASAGRRLLTRGGDAFASLVLLPVPSTKDGIHVSSTDVPLADLGGALSGADAVACYGVGKEIREAWSEAGASVIDVSRCEEYLAANALLTAEGTVAELLSCGTRAPRHTSVGIIGYGRIGQRLASLLAFLGARVKIFTSHRELSQDLCMLGISGIDSLSLGREDAADALSGLDVLINTAPARLIPPSAATVLQGTRVLELAGGDNIPACIAHERMPAIPARMFPESAGYALADAVLRLSGIVGES